MTTPAKPQSSETLQPHTWTLLIWSPAPTTQWESHLSTHSYFLGRPLMLYTLPLVSILAIEFICQIGYTPFVLCCVDIAFLPSLGPPKHCCMCENTKQKCKINSTMNRRSIEPIMWKIPSSIVNATNMSCIICSMGYA